MKILVLGAGVVGTATAYYLSRDGHEVEVVERRPGAGMETSFGNAGGLCPSFAGPWAAPGMPAKVLKMAMQSNAPVRFSFWPELRRLGWARKWFREGLHTTPQAAPDVTVQKLADQHGFLSVLPDTDLQVGDLLGFEISHPCTTFDKWSLLLEVDDDYAVLGSLKTFF